MAGQIASVPEGEDSTTGITAEPYPPYDSYRESIRSVAWPEWSTRSTLLSLSGQSGSSNYSSGSSALSSYLSNNSGYSSGLGSAGAGELTKIAHRMVNDGYTQRMVREFGDGGGQNQNHALRKWFAELDVDWVLGIRRDYGGYGSLRPDILLESTAASWHQELVEKWVRALTIIVASVKKELVTAVQRDTSAVGVAQFGKASILAMLAFVETILDVFKVENLQPVLHMYICVSSAPHGLLLYRVMYQVSWHAKVILKNIVTSLEREENRLTQAISTRMLSMRTRIARDYLWASDISRGGGKVHRKIHMLMECIFLMKKVHASTQSSAQSHNTEKLRRLIDETIGYAKDLILTKSNLCSDPNLRYLFLLNNFYFVAQVSDPAIPSDVGLRSGHHQGLQLTPECEQYMDGYLNGSWGHVLSYIPNQDSLGGTKHQKKTSSVTKFQSAFHTTYQAQKFWKVPDPWLRSLLRARITDRVISGYCDYLKEHPELEKLVSSGSNRPKIFMEMLGELFEG